MSTGRYVAVIQAGGKGTRMKSLTRDRIPKPMIRLDGKPMFEWQIDSLKKYGITEFVIIIGHLGEKIEEYFRDGENMGVSISYIRENTPLGSAGALFYLKEMLPKDKNIIFIFGDVMFEIELERMISFHERKGAEATMLAHPNSHPYDSDLLDIDSDGVVQGIDSKGNKREYWYKNIVNAGIYILNHSIIDCIVELSNLDLEKDVLFPRMKTRMIYGYITPEYVKDAGTPERFKRVEKEKKEGLWEKKCLRNKQFCAFLDRDGTINILNGLVDKEEKLELERSAAEAIRILNEAGILAIVVTNQPVVARGRCSIEEVELIHNKLETLLGIQGVYLDDIIFCPHHPDKGFPEENPLYKIECNCRKPKTGMIDNMVLKYNIDIEHSYMVGDTTLDIQTGINAGVKTILVHTGEDGKDGKFEVRADFEAEDLFEAVKIIVTNEGDRYHDDGLHKGYSHLSE